MTSGTIGVGHPRLGPRPLVLLVLVLTETPERYLSTESVRTTWVAEFAVQVGLPESANGFVVSYVVDVIQLLAALDTSPPSSSEK